MTDVQTAGDGPLSIDQAVSLLTAPAQEPAPADVAVDDGLDEDRDEASDIESEGDPAPDEAADPDEDPAIEGEQDDEPESDPETPVIAAPRSWDAVERAEFAKLPRVAQEIIAAREVERDRAVSRAHNEASEVRKQAQAELAGIEQFKTHLTQAVTQAQNAFAGKWDGLTPESWLAFSREDPTAYTIARAEYDADMAQLQQIEAANAEAAKVAEIAEQREFQSFVHSEAVKLADEAPDLVDPVEGPVRRQKVTQFLLSKGIEPEQLRAISAVELSLAYDAMRFREGKTAFKQASAAKPAPAKTPAAKATPARSATPSALPPARPSHQRTVDTLSARLTKTGSIEDGIALLLAKGKRQ